MYLWKSSPTAERDTTEAKGLEGNGCKQDITQGKKNKMEIVSETRREKRCCPLLWE